MILRRVRAGRPQIPIGAGTFLCARGWVKDIARAIVMAAERPELTGRIFNVCETQTASVRQWVECILRAADSKADLVRVPDRAVPEDLRMTRSTDQHLLVSSARFRNATGWRESPFEVAVTASVRWHLAHPPEDASSDFSLDDQALAQAL